MNSSKGISFPQKIILFETPTYINNMEYYGFSIVQVGDTSGVPYGYLRAGEDDKEHCLYYLNGEYKNDIVCPYGSYGVYGNICKEEKFLSFSVINAYYYIYEIGIIDSYFLVLREINKIPEKKDTLYHYELIPSNIRKLPSHHNLDMSGFDISKRYGFIKLYFTVTDYDYGKRKKLKFECEIKK